MLLVLGLALALYRASHRVQKHSQDRSRSVALMQKSVESLGQEIRRAPGAATTITSDERAISLLSARSASGSPEHSAEGEVLWDHWTIYYQNEGKLLRKEVPWTANESQRKLPRDVETAYGPLENLLDGEGKVLMDDLKVFRVHKPSGTRLVHFSVTTVESENHKSRVLKGAISPRS